MSVKKIKMSLCLAFVVFLSSCSDPGFVPNLSVSSSIVGDWYVASLTVSETQCDEIGVDVGDVYVGEYGDIFITESGCDFENYISFGEYEVSCSVGDIRLEANEFYQTNDFGDDDVSSCQEKLKQVYQLTYNVEDTLTGTFKVDYEMHGDKCDDRNHEPLTSYNCSFVADVVVKRIPEPTTEICDYRDNDQDGQIDEDLRTIYYHDDDGDGYGDESSSIDLCSVPDGYIAEGQNPGHDCDDDNPLVNPSVSEIPDNGIDDNCNEEIDEETEVEEPEVSEEPKKSEKPEESKGPSVPSDEILQSKDRILPDSVYEVQEL